MLVDLSPNIREVRRSPELWPAASQPSHHRVRGVGFKRMLTNWKQLSSVCSSPEWAVAMPACLSLSFSLSSPTLSPKHIFG